MNLGFIKHFASTKAEEAVNRSLEALVRFDPKGASEAELRQMDAELDKLGRDVVAAKRALADEERELEVAQKLEAQRMAAAEKLNADLEAEADPAKKATIERSLGTVMDLIDKNHATVQSHTKSAADARDWLGQLQEAFDAATEKLKTAKETLAAAQREMASAALEKRQEAERAGRAKELAGLASSRSSIGVALGAMQQAAQRDRDEAAASRMKSDALRPSAPEQDDPLIRDAMASAGGGPKPALSPSERLRALKAQKAA